MRIQDEMLLDFDDVLIRPKRSTLTSRNDVSTDREFVFKHSGKVWNGFPFFSANMDTTGTFEIANVFEKFKMPVALHKHYKIDEITNHLATSNQDYSWYSMGITSIDMEKFQKVDALISIKSVCIDVANGYTQKFIDFVEQFRDLYPEKNLMVGNVATPEMVEELLIKGADIIKVGIGGGSGCLTRAVAGVGYPQLSAIIECADAAHGLNGLICADGGIRMPSDLAKAFGAGSDFVMAGGIFAGHSESGGELIRDHTGEYKLFYGMSSKTAMNKYSGGLAKHRSSEGATIKLPFRGPIEPTILHFQGGVRSAMTYVGAKSLKNLSKCTTFVRVSNTINKVYESSKIGI